MCQKENLLYTVCLTTGDVGDCQELMVFVVVTAGLLANLTCIQAELYQMQEALLAAQNPLWVVPYTAVGANYQQLLDDFVTSATVSTA